MYSHFLPVDAKLKIPPSFSVSLERDAVFIVYMVIWGFTLAAAATAIWALAWAVQSGQFRDFRAGAASIFDDEEPVGRVTDCFPGEGGRQR